MSNSTLQEAWSLFHSNNDDIDTSYGTSVTYSAPSKIGLSTAVPHGSRRSSAFSPSGTYPSALPQMTSTSRAHSSQNLVQELQNLRTQLNNLQYTYPPGSKEYNSAVSDLNGKVDSLLFTINNSRSSDSTSSKGASSPTASETSSSSSSSKKGDSGKVYSCEKSCCSGGRKFSNKSNLVRHQREQSGEAAKLRCSFCDARFSRSSARNAHEAERKCRS